MSANDNHEFKYPGTYYQPYPQDGGCAHCCPCPCHGPHWMPPYRPSDWWYWRGDTSGTATTNAALPGGEVCSCRNGSGC